MGDGAGGALCRVARAPSLNSPIAGIFKRILRLGTDGFGGLLADSNVFQLNRVNLGECLVG